MVLVNMRTTLAFMDAEAAEEDSSVSLRWRALLVGAPSGLGCWVKKQIPNSISIVMSQRHGGQRDVGGSDCALS